MHGTNVKKNCPSLFVGCGLTDWMYVECDISYIVGIYISACKCF